MRKIFFATFSTLLMLLLAGEAFARGGGGGSGGGGGGGGGGGFGGGHGGSGGSCSGWWCFFPVVIFLIIFGAIIYGVVLAAKRRKKLIEKADKNLAAAGWDKSEIKQRVRDVFMAFQAAWSNFDLEAMKPILSESYFKRMVLEMNVLKNEKRRNAVNNPKIFGMAILDAQDNPGENQDNFTVEIRAGADDSLIDVGRNINLYTDSSEFTEYWEFVKEDGLWKLNLIKQATENAAMIEKPIKDFAAKNNFFYDPDFGWLMMPNRGVIFNQTDFMNSDINNHVIGWYRDKIVEFYTYIPRPGKNGGGRNYIIAQAILPISYKDIFVRKKRFGLFNPGGLKKMSLEWGDFNKKFDIFADSADQVNSFELLTPNFMEKIHGLPYDLNIEIVGNFLYFYTEDRRISYDEMLTVISWAFDEMKM